MGEPANGGDRVEPSPRSEGRFASWPTIATGAVLVVAGGSLTFVTAPCKPFHFAVQLAGSDDRLATWIPGCTADLDEARRSLLADGVLIVGYVVLLVGVLRRWWPRYHAPQLVALAGGVWLLPIIAGSLDVVENVLIWSGLDVRQRRFAYPETMQLPIAVATVSWLKWVVAAISVLAGVMALMLAFVRWKEPERVRVQRDPVRAVSAPVPPRELGVCCSGGGIRAAAFAIGALERLETDRVMRRARWLTAVSGGAYAATAWTLARASDPRLPAASDVTSWLSQQIRGSSSRKHRFLRNGPGGLARPVITAVAFVAFNVAVLGALVYALAWPIGWLLGSDAVQPSLRTNDDLSGGLDVPAELWLPGLLLIAAGLVVLVVSALGWRFAEWWWLAPVLAAAACCSSCCSS